MQCRFSAPLTEEQLWAVLDGEENSAIEQHLKDCPSCLARLSQLQRFAGALKTPLHRFDCPTPDQLVDFQLHQIAAAETEAIHAHLKLCASCRSEIVLFESLLKLDADAPVTQPRTVPLPGLPRFREIVATLLPRQLALRGAETNKMTAQADGVTIFLEVEALPDGFILTGQVLAAEQEQWNDALIEVRGNDDWLTTLRMDEMGEFRCETLPASTKTAALRVVAADGRTLSVPSIPLNP